MFLSQGAAQYAIWTGRARAGSGHAPRLARRARRRGKGLRTPTNDRTRFRFILPSWHGRAISCQFTKLSLPICSLRSAPTCAWRAARDTRACSKASRAEKKSRATHSSAPIPSEVFRYVNGACVLDGESRVSWMQSNPARFPAQSRRALPPGAPPGPAAAGRRRHRLFRVRHGASLRAHPGHRPG